MRTTSRCLALVIAILAFGLPTMVHAQTKTDAARILNNVERVYSRLVSYQDEGTLVVTSEEATGGRIEKIPFKTSFKRPNLFRFEWTDYGITKLGRTKMVWSNGKESFTYWEPDTYEKEESLNFAVAGATGISYRAVRTVSDLLMPDDFGGSPLKRLVKVSLAGEDVVEGVRCYRIKAMEGDDPFELWVGKTDFLIRKLRRENKLDDTLWIKEEIRRKIQVDHAIPELVFNYKPPIPLTPKKDVDLEELDRVLNPGPLAWSEFRSEEGRFSVLMPQKPMSQASSLETTQGRFDTHVFIANHSPFVCMAGYTDIPNKLLVGNDVDGFFEGFRDQLIQQVGGKLASETSRTLYGHAGREMKVHVFRGELRLRLVLVGDRLYQLAIMKADQVVEADQETFNKFFDSFKLTSITKPIAALVFRSSSSS